MAYDAHRPVRPDEDLAQIFTWQETRRISRHLTVHYKRDLYVLEDSVENRRLRGTTAVISAVLLYRVIGAWGLVPLGWGLWLTIPNAPDERSATAVA